MTQITIMRNFICFIALLVSSIVLARDFTHSTYIVGKSIKNMKTVNQINYKQFDYIYLMAAPAWNTEDFSTEKKELLKKLVHDFEYPKENGKEIIPQLIKNAHKNGTKVLLSFAGDGFKKIVSSKEQQKKFIHMMVEFVEKYNYDGIEIDWEKNLSLPLHADFICNIRKGLDGVQNKKMYLVTALHSWQKYDKPLANKLSDNIDWINIMTYDMGGGRWGKVPTHNTPLDKIEQELKYWKIFDENKLCIGLANYGFIYKGIKPGMKVVNGTLRKYGDYISYNEFLPLLQGGWTEQYDSKSKVSYYFSPDKNNFVSIENPKTLGYKIDWLDDKNYRGVFWWEFNCDLTAPKSKSGKISHKLIDVVSNLLK